MIILNCLKHGWRPVLLFCCVFLATVTLLDRAGETALFEWHEKFYYRAGAIIVYDNNKYVALKPSKGLKPSEHPEYWERSGDYPVPPATPALTSVPIPGVGQQEQSPNQDKEAANGGKPTGQPQVSPTQWASDRIYLSGNDPVSHNGRWWSNTAQTQGEEPGKSSVWVEIVTRDNTGLLEDWDAKRIYAEAGLLVLHGGFQWESIGHTQGEEPGLSEAWKRLKAAPGGTSGQWEPDMVYLPDSDPVSHNGRWWRNTQRTQGEEPGKYPVWVEYDQLDRTSLIQLWKTDAIYAEPGALVRHNDQVWENTAWTQGEEPGVSLVWKLQGTNSAGENGADTGNDSPVQGEETQGGEAGDTGGAGAWEESREYPTAGILVEYGGYRWTNLWWAKPGDRPGVSDAWYPVYDSADTVLPWFSGVAYHTSGVKVVYDGLVWENRWWTRGNEPGKSGVWRMVSGSGGQIAAWSASYIYDQAGTIISYAGKNWKNKWWSQGDIPGEALVWEVVNE